jgi:hypothetical protein
MNESNPNGLGSSTLDRFNPNLHSVNLFAEHYVV